MRGCKQTGGVFLTLPNWASLDLQVLAEASVSGNMYILDVQPIPETIQVYMNGASVQGTWSYIEAQQAVGPATAEPVEGILLRLFTAL